MLPLHQRVAFGLFALAMLALGGRGFYRLYRRIAHGRLDTESRTDRPWQRLWYALRTTLLQERVFRRRQILGVFHSFIFYAFVLYLLVNALDGLGGYVELRSVALPFLVNSYGALTDLFSVLAIVGVLAFMLRRYVLPARKDFAFNERTYLDPKVRQGYIRRDSLIVSLFILLHVLSRVIGNAADLAIHGTSRMEPFSSALARVFAGPHAMMWRVLGYWGALGSIFAFLAYFPYTKHIHLLGAPVKYFLKRRESSGTMPMARIDMDAAEPQVGAAQLADLAQPRLLDAYACIQCNRCQDVCPASVTGKALSPAALEINKRMVLNSITEEVSAFALGGSSGFEQGLDAGPSLLEAVIPREAVWACTTCGACMEVCPTQDEQMLDILDIRRNLVMVQGEFPTQLQAAFRGMERAGNPWALPRDKRMEWAAGLKVPTVETNPDPAVLYWVGCAASYDPSAGRTARAVVQLLAEAGVNFAVLGKREVCTGDSARRAGNELLYQQMAGEAIEVLDSVRPRLVLASCPHCVNTIANEFPQLGGHFEVRHHTEYLASLVSEGRLQPLAAEGSMTFHDPCYLGRHRGSYEEPRSILKVLSNDYVEMPRSKSNAFCCGAGGAQFWKEEEPGSERISENRFREAQSTLASAKNGATLAVGCPFCKSMLQSTPAAGADQAIAVKDVAELLWEGVQRSKRTGAVESDQAGAAQSAPSVVEAELVDEVDVETATAEVADAEATARVGSAAINGVPADGGGGVQKPVNASPPRRKWTPRSAAQRSAAAEAQTEVPQQDGKEADRAVAEPAAPRKKWMPKAAAPSPDPAPEQDVKITATTDAEAKPTSPTIRKKWQPGGAR